MRGDRRRGRGTRRAAVVLGLVLAGLLVPVAAASAHPLGNFTVNEASALRVRPDRVLVDHVLDLAEIPSSQARPDIDRLGADAWRDRQCHAVLGRLALAVDGRPVRLSPTSAQLRFPPGAAGLTTTRLTCRAAAEVAVRDGGTLAYADGNFLDRVGWREIIAAGDGTRLAADVPATSPSRLAAHRVPARPAEQPARRPLGHADGPARRPRRRRPAHRRRATDPAGGARRRPAHRRLHRRRRPTSSHRRPRRPRPRPRARARRPARARPRPRQDGHGGVPGRRARLAPAGRRDRADRHCHPHPRRAAPRPGPVGVDDVRPGTGLPLARPRRRAGAGRHRRVAAAGRGAPRPIGATPARPSAPRPPPRKDHHHGEQAPSGGGTALLVRAEPDVDVVVHRHGGRRHTHAPVVPGPVRIRNLLAMGLAGGLVPNPSALVVLLGAVALRRAWFGVLLVVTYGAGMATTLVGIGALLARARDRLARGHGRLRWGRQLPLVLPAVTATAIVVVGLGLALRAGLTIA